MRWRAFSLESDWSIVLCQGTPLNICLTYAQSWLCFSFYETPQRVDSSEVFSLTEWGCYMTMALQPLEWPTAIVTQPLFLCPRSYRRSAVSYTRKLNVLDASRYLYTCLVVSIRGYLLFGLVGVCKFSIHSEIRECVTGTLGPIERTKSCSTLDEFFLATCHDTIPRLCISGKLCSE